MPPPLPPHAPPPAEGGSGSPSPGRVAASRSNFSHCPPTGGGVPSPPPRQSSRPRPCACSAPSARERPNLVERHPQPDVEHVLAPAGRNDPKGRPVDVAHAAPEVVHDRRERDVAPEPEIVASAGRESPPGPVPRG